MHKKQLAHVVFSLLLTSNLLLPLSAFAQAAPPPATSTATSTQTTPPPSTATSTQPIITSISPSQGTSNTSVTIYGTNLTSGGNPAIKFYGLNGALAGTIYFINMNYISSQIITFFPNATDAILMPGTYQVNVVTPNGTSNPITFTLQPSSISTQSFSLLSSAQGGTPGDSSVTLASQNAITPSTLPSTTTPVTATLQQIEQNVKISVAFPTSTAQVGVSTGQVIAVLKVTNNNGSPIYLGYMTNLFNFDDRFVFNLSSASEANRTVSAGGFRYLTVKTKQVAQNNETFKISTGDLNNFKFYVKESDFGLSLNEDFDLNDTIYELSPIGFPTSTATVTAVTTPPPPPTDPGGFWSRLRNAITSVFVAVPSVDLKVKAPNDAPDENYTDGPIQIAPGNWLRVIWQSSKVQDCRMNYFGLLPANLGATAENQAGEPVSHLGNQDGDSFSYQAPNEEGVMEFEFQCRKDTDGFEISDRVRVNVEALTAGTAGGITPPPPVKGFLGRSADRIRVLFGGAPSAPLAPPVQQDETVPPIAGIGPETERGEEVQAPATGLRGLLNAILSVPAAARDVVQNVIELVINRPQAPTLDTAEPVGVTPKPAEPVGIGEPERAEPVGSVPTEESIPPIAGIREPAQTIPPIAGIAIPSLTNNVLDLGKAHTIAWQYQRGGEVQAPIVHLYLVGEGIDPRSGNLARAYKYIGPVSASAGKFTWSVPADFAKPAEPVGVTFTYRIGIGLSSNQADPQIQSTSNPISVPVPSPLITPRTVEPVAPPPTVIPTRTVEPVAPPPTLIPPKIVEPLAPPPPPPSTILEPTRVLPPPPPAPPPTILEPILLSPTVNLKANSLDSLTITSGAAATLSWTSSGASSCTASNGWSGAKASSGSESTGALTASKTYALTCSNRTGSVSDSVTVTVQALLIQPRLRLFYNQDELRQIASVLEQLLEIMKKLSELTPQLENID